MLDADDGVRDSYWGSDGSTEGIKNYLLVVFLCGRMMFLSTLIIYS